MVRKFPPFRSKRKKRSTSEGTPQFPNGISGKLPYHLTSNRNFRIFWPNGKQPLFRHIGLLFGERLDTPFTSSDSKISGFTRPHVIGFVADLFFATLEGGFIFFSDSLSNSPDACGR